MDDTKPVNQSSHAPTASTTQSVENNKVHDKVDIKSRKLLKRPAKIVCFARNTLFVHTLRMQKNKKFKKAKKQILASNKGDIAGTSDQQASTSTSSNGHVSLVSEKKSHKRKQPSSKVKNEGDIPVNALKEDLKSIKSESHADINQSRINRTVPFTSNIIKENEVLQRCDSYSLLMQGLRETTGKHLAFFISFLQI
jgi:hypothetical protein